MSCLGELLRVDHRLTLEFFRTGLKDVCESSVDELELAYNATILAHYAETPTEADMQASTPASLTHIYDHFVTDFSLNDPLVLETAGSQCMLMAGFFEDQMRQRHNISWYAKLGAGFFIRSSYFERSAHKARLLYKISRSFELWRQRHALLSRELRDTAYLLKPPKPS